MLFKQKFVLLTIKVMYHVATEIQNFIFHVVVTFSINVCAADGGRARSRSGNLLRILSELRSEVRSNVAYRKWNEVSFLCIFLSDVMLLMNTKQIILIAVIY